jgi:hypothetical protein
VASFRRVGVGVGPDVRPSPGCRVSAHQPPRPALKNSKLSVAERGACCGSPSVVKLRPLRNRARFSGATFIRAVQMLYLPHSCQQTGLWNVERPKSSVHDDSGHAASGFFEKQKERNQSN